MDLWASVKIAEVIGTLVYTGIGIVFPAWAKPPCQIAKRLARLPAVPTLFGLAASKHHR